MSNFQNITVNNTSECITVVGINNRMNLEQNTNTSDNPTTCVPVGQSKTLQSEDLLFTNTSPTTTNTNNAPTPTLLPSLLSTPPETIKKSKQEEKEIKNTKTIDTSSTKKQRNDYQELVNYFEIDERGSFFDSDNGKLLIDEEEIEKLKCSITITTTTTKSITTEPLQKVRELLFFVFLFIEVAFAFRFK